MTAVPWILGALALVVAAGWVSPLTRTLVGALACLAGVIVAAIGVMSSPPDVGQTFGGSALMATGSMAMAMVNFRRVVLGIFLALLGIPFAMVLWLSLKLGAADAATINSTTLQWIALGVVVSLVAFAVELMFASPKKQNPST